MRSRPTDETRATRSADSSRAVLSQSGGCILSYMVVCQTRRWVQKRCVPDDGILVASDASSVAVVVVSYCCFLGDRWCYK